MGLARRIPWQLPKNLNPVGFTRCIQVHIPDYDEYERLLYNAIYDNFCITWMSWQRDGTRNGQNQVELWRRVLSTWTHCSDQPTATSGEDIQSMPEFRTVCDGDSAYLEWKVCTCPETWERLAPVTIVSPGGQPGPGQGTPGPGQNQQYCYTLQANQPLRLPPVVNSGDTITLDSAKGSWWDGNPLNTWQCPDGSTFYSDACSGSPQPSVSGDPVGGSPHMSVIVQIGASYYGLTVGVPFTVPGGVVNAIVQLQANTASLIGDAGSVDVCATIQNNAMATWTHTFDFSVTTDGFTPYSGGGAAPATWTPGNGWEAISDPHAGYILSPLIASTLINTATVYYDDPGSPTGDSGVFVTNAAFSLSVLHIVPIPSGGTNLIANGATPQTYTQFVVAIEDAGSTGLIVIRKLILTGSGVDPF